MQNQLVQNEQALVQLQNQYAQELAEEEVVTNRKVLNDIMEYLRTYNSDKGYQFIFSNTFGGALLYAHPTLDITQDVLKGINARYAQGKKK
jgi:outer membrane protein